MSYSQDHFLPKYKYSIHKEVLNDSIEVAYVDEGDKDKPTLLMVHGLGGYIKNWYFTIDGLKDHFRCIAIDLPGYGHSTMEVYPADNYLDFFSEIVDAFAQKLALKDVVLLGHSMGGQVSTITALKKPDWLAQLILAAPAGFETFTETEGTFLINYSSQQAIMGHSEEQVRAAYKINFVTMPQPVGEEMIQERLMAREADWFPKYAKVREMGVRGMLGHPVKDQLSQINVPTLVMYGDNDLLIPNRYFHKDLTTEKVLNIGEAIPQATLILIERAGHMLQMDNAPQFNHVILKHINPN